MDGRPDDDPDEVRLHQRMADPPPRRIDVAVFVLLLVARPFAMAAAWLARVVVAAARGLATAISLPVQLLRSRRDDW